MPRQNFSSDKRATHDQSSDKQNGIYSSIELFTALYIQGRNERKKCNALCRAFTI